MSINKRDLGIVGLSLILIIKIFLIAFYGPLVQPDSGGYLTYANQIISNMNWLLDQPGGGGDASYRMLGYPLLIAANKFCLGAAFAYGVLFVQAISATVAAYVLYTFLVLLTKNRRIAAVVVLFYSTGQQLVFDVFLLTDGLYGSLIVIVISILGKAALTASPKIGCIGFAGMMLAVSFFIREATLQLSICFLPLLLLIAFRVRNHSPISIVLSFAIPLVLAVGSYMAWNQYRSGATFVTTGMRTAALLPLVTIAGQGVPIFRDNGRIANAARNLVKEFNYDEVLQINRRLEKEGMTGIEIDREVRALYWRSLARFPLAFFLHAVSELNLHKRSLVMLNPLRSLVHLEEFRNEGQLSGLGSRVRKSIQQGSSYWLISVLILELLFTVASAIVGFFSFIVFPLAFVCRLLSKGSYPSQWPLLACLWLIYFGFLSAYAMVRVEDRYLIGVGPIILIIGILMIKDFLAQWSPNWINSSSPSKSNTSRKIQKPISR